MNWCCTPHRVVARARRRRQRRPRADRRPPAPFPRPAGLLTPVSQPAPAPVPPSRARRGSRARRRRRASRAPSASRATIRDSNRNQIVVEIKSRRRAIVARVVRVRDGNARRDAMSTRTPRVSNGMKEMRARGIMYTSLRAIRIDRSVGRADDSPHTPTTMRRATAATTATTAAPGRARVSRRARATATRWTATRRRAARDETGRATIGNRRGGGAMDGARAARDDGATRATGEKREETATR